MGWTRWTNVTELNARFNAEVLPCLDAAYNLARWLVRDEHVAEDIVQDAFLRAFRYFGSFRGGQPRPWLLGIVRNCCYTWFVQQKRAAEFVSVDEADAPVFDRQGVAETPETLLAQKMERAHVTDAIARLPLPFREVLVLREIEELSYEEIAQMLEIPQGTVMSRLSRARGQLRNHLTAYR
jgi:RNA polymerase sigma-70 factor, ECF subfamily